MCVCRNFALLIATLPAITSSLFARGFDLFLPLISLWRLRMFLALA